MNGIAFASKVRKFVEYFLPLVYIVAVLYALSGEYTSIYTFERLKFNIDVLLERKSVFYSWLL